MAGPTEALGASLAKLTELPLRLRRAQAPSIGDVLAQSDDPHGSGEDRLVVFGKGEAVEEERFGRKGTCESGSAGPAP